MSKIIPIGSYIKIKKEYNPIILKEDVTLKVLTCIGVGYIVQLIKGSDPGFSTGYNVITHSVIDDLLKSEFFVIENGLDRAARRVKT